VWAIEGYELLAQVGHGSTGVVVSARDVATGVNVAVKYLAREVHEIPGFLVRYRGEVSMLGLVEHPQVANVYELVETEHAAAVVTELVDGVSLRAILEQTGPLEPEAAVYVLKGALLGLREVHGQGIVHRSLKPENVLVEANGNIKIVDVGIAAPSYPGAPANEIYAASELWSGGQPTAASDVFAAAAMLYECLSGHPPQGTGGAYLGRSGQPADPAIAAIPAESAPRQARQFMAMCLAVDPQSRPVDARAALEQLDVVAFSAFGSAWHEAGQALLTRRLPHVTVGAPLPPPSYVAAPPPPPPPEPAPSYPVRVSAPGPDPRSYGDEAPRSGGPTAPRSGGPMAPRSGGPMAPRSGGPMAPRSGGPVAPRSGGPGAPRSGGPASPFAVPVGVLTADRDERDRGSSGWADPDATGWVVTEAPSHRATSNRLSRILAAVGLLIVILAGTAYAVTSAFGPDDPSSLPVETNSHTPIITPGPTIPVPTTTGPDADAVKPTTPAGLRVTSRSISGVTINWADAADNVEVAGYVIFRNGTQVGTSYDPGYADSGLNSDTRYQYAVAAFDAAGNVSERSPALNATTLKEPDVSPPTIPQSLRTTGQGTTTVALAWNRSTDNVGVAGYEVFRDNVAVANVPVPPGNPAVVSHTVTGVGVASTHQYKVRAFDASENASGDSNRITVTTRSNPDTTPPNAPTNLHVVGTPTVTTISLGWNVPTDNVGVTGYRVYRGAMLVGSPSSTAFLDQGLSPSTSYTYTVTAVDAEENESAPSAPRAAATADPPPTPTPTPTPDPTPEVTSVALTVNNVSCVVTVEVTVTVTAPMDVTVNYTITGVTPGSVTISVGPSLSRTQALPGPPDGNSPGTAFASAGGGHDDTEAWIACDPPTTDPPPPTE
jgi:chitodextrinase